MAYLCIRKLIPFSNNMKKLGFILLLLSASYAANAGVYVMEGKYQNRNVYVQNSIASSGVGYCTYEVRVNGELTTDEINSSAFEIDLSALALKYGDKVQIEIKYKEGCSPKVLNPDVLKPKPTFETQSISVDGAGLIKWTTTNEQGSIPFTIEQFRWNKWIPVGEVDGRGLISENSYQFKATLHSGENKFRVKQSGSGNSQRFSLATTIVSGAPKLEYSVSKNNELVTFSGETLYEVYDYYGAIVKKGYGKTVNMSSLAKGGYYLCYDNEVSDFRRK